jgi:ATP-dependent protease ClpP protease subunit
MTDTNPFDGSPVTPANFDTVEADYHKIIAEAASRRAQAEYYAAQAQGQLIDNETARILADSAGIALGREMLKEVWEGASNGRNRSYHFTDAVTADSVEQAVDVLNRWQRIDGANDRPWRFVICSNGGSVIHGMKLYSTLKSIARYREIVTVATGMCASMGTVIHQAGTTRLIEPGCSYMIHDVSADVAGNISAMQDQMDWLNKLNSQLHVALAEKAKLSIDEIATMAKRRDSWFMPAEVVEMGLADAIGFATE